MLSLLKTTLIFSREYTRKVEVSYGRPWPRPWPCGTVWVHWIPVGLNPCKQALDLANGPFTRLPARWRRWRTPRTCNRIARYECLSTVDGDCEAAHAEIAAHIRGIGKGCSHCTALGAVAICISEHKLRNMSRNRQIPGVQVPIGEIPRNSQRSLYWHAPSAIWPAPFHQRNAATWRAKTCRNRSPRAKPKKLGQYFSCVLPVFTNSCVVED